MIWTKTATALATLDPAVAYAADVDRSVLGDPLPDEFIVYGLISAAPEMHADDDDTERFYRMQLSIYNRAGLSSLPDTDTAMKAQGFHFAGEARIPYNPETRHYGLARDYTIIVNQ